MKKIIVIFLLFSMNANAWDGYDWNRSSLIEIEKGNLVREGEQIEFYDWSKGEYETLDIDSVDSYGYHVEIEGTDSYGMKRTFEMD